MFKSYWIEFARIGIKFLYFFLSTISGNEFYLIDCICICIVTHFDVTSLFLLVICMCMKVNPFRIKFIFTVLPFPPCNIIF